MWEGFDVYKIFFFHFIQGVLGKKMTKYDMRTGGGKRAVIKKWTF